MARTRTTIRRVDPWSVLKFAFVANLVLLGVYLLVGAVAWAFVRRLQLIDTICGLAQSVGYQECAVDGQALFDTVLVLGLLGVVIQTGVFVFLAFLANLIFDLIGGIAITLDDDRPNGAIAGTAARRGVGSTVGTVRKPRTTTATAVSDVTSTLTTVGSRIGEGASRAVSGVGRAMSGIGQSSSSSGRSSGPGGRTGGPSTSTGGPSTASGDRSGRPTTTGSGGPTGAPAAPRQTGAGRSSSRPSAPATTGGGTTSPTPPPRAPARDEVDDEPLFG